MRSQVAISTGVVAHLMTTRLVYLGFYYERPHQQCHRRDQDHVERLTDDEHSKSHGTQYKVLQENIHRNTNSE